MNAIQDGWTKCPQGELAQLSSRLRIRTYCRQAGIAAAVAATVGFTGFAAAKMAESMFLPSSSGGACHSTSQGCGGCSTAIPTDGCASPAAAQEPKK